ncbi:VPLPA-CTERM sorting domain-containing protein [Pseudooceanicola onchidii]|uniref:VPLPA-CTERM sorting domain-containing protein n=1 Tax=Pseudooceanicola onchidii TaxID=2562279 RepID=UPI0010AA7931|nr:VPLPA-CTERM sorting domain-containing protein [Pseudooceanicola onchidii]
MSSNFMLSLSAALAMTTLVPVTALAANVSPNIIFGSGNTNGGFTVGTGTYDGPNIVGPVVKLELGLRAKLRFDENNLPSATYNYDGVDTYTFNAGAAPGGFGWDAGSPTTPVWSFDWSVGTDLDFTKPSNGYTSLNALTYQMRIDGDAGAGTNFFNFDPINQSYADHALGNMITANGDGTVAADATGYADLLNKSSVAQNSWNYEFFNETTDAFFMPPLANFDPSVAGSYRIEFEAFYDDGTGAGAVSVASTGININVVDPTPAVPVPAALPMLLSAFGGFAVVRRRRRKAASV